MFVNIRCRMYCIYKNYVSGVFPNVRGALTFEAETQDVVTAATVAIDMPELGVETSAEVDGQLFVVLSALTEGESFDIVMSAGGDHVFESWRKLHGRWNPHTAGRARSLLREILSPTQMKLPELMGCHREDGTSRETPLWPTRCSRKCTQSCGRYSHEFP